MLVDTPSGLNKFLMFKLPSAFLCGIRVKEIDSEKCEALVKHRWINQNPFGSMYFAVQAMAAEITTGALVMSSIQKSGRKISMLVVSNRAKFFKKATGKIHFVCDQGKLIPDILQKSIDTGEGQAFWLKSVGYDEKGQVVAEMEFEWSVKAKL